MSKQHTFEVKMFGRVFGTATSFDELGSIEDPIIFYNFRPNDFAKRFFGDWRDGPFDCLVDYQDGTFFYREVNKEVTKQTEHEQLMNISWSALI